MEHQPVLLTEAIQGLAIQPDGVYIDGTFGRGGHARAILAELSDNGRLLVFDKDPEAIVAANALREEDSRVSVYHASFANMADVIEKEKLANRVNGILLDLGISSPQLDDAARGFSFLRDGPLDMRMDTTRGLSAEAWLTEVTASALMDVLKTYGEERFSRRIAEAIVQEREVAPIQTTKRLADIIAKAVPFKEKHKHPATRCAQIYRRTASEAPLNSLH